MDLLEDKTMTTNMKMACCPPGDKRGTFSTKQGTPEEIQHASGPRQLDLDPIEAKAG